MALFKRVNGERVEMTPEEEQAIRDEWDSYVRPTTEEKLIEQLDSITTSASDRDKALAYLFADFWLYITTGKRPNQATQQEITTARQQVRKRLETHLRNVKGLST